MLAFDSPCAKDALGTDAALRQAVARPLNISVYAGLSVPEAAVHAILPSAQVRKPAKQFDLLCDIKEGAHVVVIIDGVFHQTPAVSPIEIMDALRRGLLVYGASSMGALRAAELHSFGMRGEGQIFEFIRESETFRDDFVAQTFHEVNGQIVELSCAYVDFHFALERLRHRGECTVEQAKTLCDLFADLYYPERTQPSLLSKLRAAPESLKQLAQKAFSEPKQKTQDALAVLGRVKLDLLKVKQLNSLLNPTPQASSKTRREPAPESNQCR